MANFPVEYQDAMRELQQRVWKKERKQLSFAQMHRDAIKMYLEDSYKNEV